MIYSIQNIANIIQAKETPLFNASIEHLLIDSRKIIFPNSSLFFALESNRRDGHTFIEEVYNRGVRNFVVSKNIDAAKFPNANFLWVTDTLQALQQLAAYHRSQFNIPVIGITGSNGKTIVKEWLYQLLSADYNIVRSPRSYNSQIGVPLSVWQMTAQNSLAIFEAGISESREMEKLERMIQPTIGILTNIGDAHNEGFTNTNEKFSEKIKLFTNAEILIGRAKDFTVQKVEQSSSIQKPIIKTYGFSLENEFVIQSVNIKETHSEVSIQYKANAAIVIVPFIDNASIENAITCICTMLQLGYHFATINERIALLEPVEMRMQLKKAINNCAVLNDSYSNDVSSLSIALDYLKQQSGSNATTVILSDILQTGIAQEQLYTQVATELQHRNISRLIGIGEQLHQHQNLFSSITQTSFFRSTDEFLQQANTHQFKDEFILLKGARVFAFERIDKWLEQKVHQTVLEINLSAMAHNLKAHQNKLKPGVKLMAMVKAFSYGSGSVEVARLLQFHKTDYLAVAYADEGVELRKAGISLPIMVMNADEAGFNALVEYNLEPEIYSFNIYQSFHQFLQQQGIANFPVHIKLNTGMNRLGFDETDVPTIANSLHQNNTMVVMSVFSHLTSSESAEHDVYTLQQAEIFKQCCDDIESTLGYSFIKHISNSAAIFRHPNLQMDMVRLGIGLYGVDSNNQSDLHLQTVATLKSTIAQIRNVEAGATVGYNKKGVLNRKSKIATVRIGYADGFSRQLGNGVGSVYIHQQLAPVVGNVCMDMIMVDVTDIPNVQEEDVVEIFGNHLPVQQVAKWCNTISYEIMTSVSQRVKRVYIEE